MKTGRLQILPPFERGHPKKVKGNMLLGHSDFRRKRDVSGAADRDHLAARTSGVDLLDRLEVQLPKGCSKCGCVAAVIQTEANRLSLRCASCGAHLGWLSLPTERFFIARGHAPVLELCRDLVAAGFSPASSLEAWRGNTLRLRVGSIGEAARLTIADDRHGMPRLRHRQERPPGYVAASPVAQIVNGREIATPTRQATWEPAP